MLVRSLVPSALLFTVWLFPSTALANDTMIRCAAAQLLELTEGSLGALIMVVAGIGTIIASAFGAYRAAISLLVVAIGSFILRSFVNIFFNAGDLVYDARCHAARATASVDLGPGQESFPESENVITPPPFIAPSEEATPTTDPEPPVENVGINPNLMPW